MRKYSFILLSLVLFGCSTETENNSYNPNLSAREFASLIETTPDAQIVDVRTQGEFRGGHISNASNIDIATAEFASMAAALDKDKPVFVYCLSGSRSAAFLTYLRDRGFDKVYDMPGGLLEWRRNGLPEVRAMADSPGMSRDEYNQLIGSAETVLIDFYAEWCAPCKRMEPYINEIAEELGDRGRVIRIDVDQNTELALGMGVSAIPVLKLYKDKEESWTHVGFMDEESLRAGIF